MNLSRLMILGMLAERGPVHGHQVRRAGERANAEAWGGITGGAIDAELRWLEEFETAGGGTVRPRRGPAPAPSRRDSQTGPPAPAGLGEGGA